MIHNIYSFPSLKSVPISLCFSGTCNSPEEMAEPLPQYGVTALYSSTMTQTSPL